MNPARSGPAARPIGRAPEERPLTRTPGARPIVRASGLPVRRGRIRRASAGLSPLRAGAAFVMVLAALGIHGVGASPAFAYRHLDFDAGTTAFTSTDAVVAALGLDVETTNLFAVQTDRLQSQLMKLPAVVDAKVSVNLPDTIRITLAERQAILVWIVGGRRLLVDRSGLVFAETVPGGPGDALSTITDHRVASAGLAVGATIDPVDLEAARRLAPITPGDLGSRATGLRIWIEDSDGFEIHPIKVPWIAAFGFYTQSLRTTELIPGQLRLLRSFLAGREATTRRIVLADDRNGTYVPR